MPEAMGTSHSKGLLGEAAAEAYLVEQGMTCLGRRYHSPCGEIDLVMLEEQTLVFVEVKARSVKTLSEAQIAVSPAKQKRIIQTALYYLNKFPQYHQHMIRFDVVAISGEFIQHIPNAFQGYGW